MENFAVVILLMTVLISLSAMADKIKLPYPVLLVVAGILIGFIPGLPVPALDPETIFLLFLPPLLYDAASNTSWHDFKSAIRPISALAITLVFFTTTSVAIAAHYLIPGFSWPLAFVLGAIVSPPDAVAATSITRGLGLNKKVITIIEGESLVNDASALIAYRYAVAAVTTGTFVLWKAGLQFLLLTTGGLLTGLVIGYIFVAVHKLIRDNSIVETSLTLLAPFVSYLIAEHFHTSGVLAVVCTGLVVSWQSKEIFSSPTRMQTRIVWDTLIFLMNGAIFILIGLQLPAIISEIRNYTIWALIEYSLIISFVTILIRILWVFAGAFGQKLFGTKRKQSDFYSQEDETLWKNVLIVAWTGTRGVVSLATALALPLVTAAGTPFPQRPLILFLAFVVIFVTLVIQGLSLPLLIRMLKVENKYDYTQERKELQFLMANSILNFIDNAFPWNLENDVQAQLRTHYELTSKALRQEIHDIKTYREDQGQQLFIPLSRLVVAQVEILKFQRSLLIRFHKENMFTDETIKQFENELDIEELRLNSLLKNVTDR